MAKGGTGILGGIGTVASGIALAFGTEGGSIAVSAGLVTTGLTGIGMSGGQFAEGFGTLYLSPTEEMPGQLPANTGEAVGIVVQKTTGWETAPAILGMTETAIGMVASGLPTTTLETIGAVSTQANFLAGVYPLSSTSTNSTAILNIGSGLSSGAASTSSSGSSSTSTNIRSGTSGVSSRGGGGGGSGLQAAWRAEGDF